MRELLDALPKQDGDGWYFELRKLTGYWLCVKTNMRTMQDACSNCGDTPEEAVSKMLKRLDIVLPKLSQERIDYMDAQHRKDRRCPGLNKELKPCRSNNEVAAREYAGGFSSFIKSNVKHSLVASHRSSGEIALTIFYHDASGNQNMQSIMLTNEQKVDLGEYLVKHKAILWKDIIE